MLADCLYHAATYDQLNVGSVVCLEAVARRLQAIVDAHSVSATKPNWSIAKYHSGSASSLNVSSEGLRRYATRNAKGEIDLHIAQARVRDMKYGGGRASGAREEEHDDEPAEPWWVQRAETEGEDETKQESPPAPDR